MTLREMSQPVYLVCGVPGSGKTWVCRQLKDKFTYVPHDQCWTHPTKTPDHDKENPEWAPGAKSTHVEEVVKAVRSSLRPIITESPFNERMLKEDLEKKGVKVIPYFVIEEPETSRKRYEKREGKIYPKHFYSRAKSIGTRAKEWDAPHGTSDEVLEMLRAVN